MMNFKTLSRALAATLVAAAFASMAACSDNDDPQGLTFESKNMQLTPGQAQKMRVTNGLAPYRVTSTDSTVAIATDAPGGIEVRAYNKGNALIFVSDMYQRIGSFAVVVQPEQP